ncbi:hypothetical protein RRG08_047421 [Elysia crispata]|uniref:Uncharacterized protein n=1 Tax=Elysia crispata TaxID=231223 RepID=A0AAE1D572_9GAST|nr:hypothetical protein RRG08_047421 [Elysia crispata]
MSSLWSNLNQEEVVSTPGPPTFVGLSGPEIVTRRVASVQGACTCMSRSAGQPSGHERQGDKPVVDGQLFKCVDTWSLVSSACPVIPDWRPGPRERGSPTPDGREEDKKVNDKGDKCDGYVNKPTTRLWFLAEQGEKVDCCPVSSDQTNNLATLSTVPGPGHTGRLITWLPCPQRLALVSSRAWHVGQQPCTVVARPLKLDGWVELAEGWEVRGENLRHQLRSGGILATFVCQTFMACRHWDPAAPGGSRLLPGLVHGSCREGGNRSRCKMGQNGHALKGLNLGDVSGTKDGCPHGSEHSLSFVTEVLSPWDYPAQWWRPWMMARPARNEFWADNRVQLVGHVSFVVTPVLGGRDQEDFM